MVSYESFIGHKVHKLDAKNRVSIPANMRADLGGEFYITLGNDNNCLAIRTVENWKAFMEKIQTLPASVRKQAHFRFVANAERLSLDPNGRIILSEYLRNKINVESKQEIVVFGADDRVELWNKDVFYAQLEEGNSVEWADVFDEYGI